MTCVHIHKCAEKYSRKFILYITATSKLTAFFVALLVLFSTKYHLLHNFIFFWSNNMFFINDTLELKYQPSCLKANNCTYRSITCAKGSFRAICVILTRWLYVEQDPIIFFSLSSIGQCG